MQYTNHYAMESCVIAIIFKWTLVYVSLLLWNLLNSAEFINSVSYSGKTLLSPSFPIVSLKMQRYMDTQTHTEKILYFIIY